MVVNYAMLEAVAGPAVPEATAGPVVPKVIVGPELEIKQDLNGSRYGGGRSFCAQGSGRFCYE